MFMVILLAALSIFAIAATVAALRTDGYRRTPTDWSRLPDRSASDDRPQIGQTLWKVDAARVDSSAPDAGVRRLEPAHR
ncbi:hypothetical protein [Microbacterium sp. SS28]|uniref:hypothetical protein n=1 Tax=Microbacterium sp. SS28 TaxID=2919948 RepID=UPI001FAB2AD2|nr:hypothetical protein [Microbacterium sp. SS28]